MATFDFVGEIQEVASATSAIAKLLAMGGDAPVPAFELRSLMVVLAEKLEAIAERGLNMEMSS